MKGFEVRFRGETVRITVDVPIVFSVIVQKRHGKLDMSVHGWLTETDAHAVWMLADDLKAGDEIMIERKEVKECSPPMLPPSDFDPNRLPTPEELQEMWHYKLQYFHKLENILQKEGIIC